MNAFKTQQYRWTKGAAECAVKNLPRVLKAKDVALFDKMHAFSHLLNSGIFICVFLLSLFSVPLVYIQFNNPEYSSLLTYAAFGSFNVYMVGIFFWLSYEHTRGGFSIKNLVVFLLKFPFFLSLSLGMAFHNAIAAFEGYIGRKTPFVRTPKFNLEGIGVQKGWRKNKYVSKGISFTAVMELALALMFLATIIISVVHGIYGMLPFHILLFLGYGIISGYSFVHARMVS